VLFLKFEENVCVKDAFWIKRTRELKKKKKKNLNIMYVHGEEMDLILFYKQNLTRVWDSNGEFSNRGGLTTPTTNFSNNKEKG
jgi:hypothetical protein